MSLFALAIGISIICSFCIIPLSFLYIPWVTRQINHRYPGANSRVRQALQAEYDTYLAPIILIFTVLLEVQVVIYVLTPRVANLSVFVISDGIIILGFVVSYLKLQKRLKNFIQI